LKRYLSDRRQPPEEAVQAPDRSTVEGIVRLAMRELAETIAAQPVVLWDLEWRDLERVLREVFERLGFQTQLTRSGKDGGYDLELRCSDEGREMCYLIEVKHWIQGSKKPGKEDFTDFLEVVGSRKEPNTKGLLLSTSGFTREVVRGRTEVERQRIHLGDGSKIVSLCQSYVETRAGIWESDRSLHDILFAHTF
jgi:hypothetical protein